MKIITHVGFFVLFLAKIRVKTERRALYVNLAFSNSCTTFRLISEKVKPNNLKKILNILFGVMLISKSCLLICLTFLSEKVP